MTIVIVGVYSEDWGQHLEEEQKVWAFLISNLGYKWHLRTQWEPLPHVYHIVFVKAIHSRLELNV